jgi:hypothetical protein
MESASGFLKGGLQVFVKISLESSRSPRYLMEIVQGMAEF